MNNETGFKEFAESVKRAKKRKQLHSLVEKRLLDLLLRLYPSSCPEPEVAGVLGGRNDLIQFFPNGRRVVFELFATPSQVPQDLRLLERSTADTKIAILLDKEIDPKLSKAYFHKKPDAFPYLWLSKLMLPQHESECEEELRKLIEQPYVSAQAAHQQTQNAVFVDEIRGMTVGGDAYPEMLFSPDDNSTNSLIVCFAVRGKYPLRSMRAKITNETKRINASKSNAGKSYPSQPIFDGILGDVPVRSTGKLASISLDPGVTNYYRFDISSLNGFSWEIVSFVKAENQWRMNLVYRFRRIGDKVTIEPAKFKNTLMVY